MVFLIFFEVWSFISSNHNHIIIFRLDQCWPIMICRNTFNVVGFHIQYISIAVSTTSIQIDQYETLITSAFVFQFKTSKKFSAELPPEGFNSTDQKAKIFNKFLTQIDSCGIFWGLSSHAKDIFGSNTHCCFSMKYCRNWWHVLPMLYSYHVHLSFLAWSQTSCRSGSYWTTIVFSMKDPWGVGPDEAP